jgi:hypothetical protein
MYPLNFLCTNNFESGVGDDFSVEISVKEHSVEVMLSLKTCILSLHQHPVLRNVSVVSSLQLMKDIWSAFVQDVNESQKLIMEKYQKDTVCIQSINFFRETPNGPVHGGAIRFNESFVYDIAHGGVQILNNYLEATFFYGIVRMNVEIIMPDGSHEEVYLRMPSTATFEDLRVAIELQDSRLTIGEFRHHKRANKFAKYPIVETCLNHYNGGLSKSLSEFVYESHLFHHYDLSLEAEVGVEGWDGNPLM